MTPPSALPELLALLEQEVRQLQSRRLLRTLTTVEACDGPHLTIGGRALVAWCTNDYLGLSCHPRVIEAACDAARCWGVGARASRLLAGSTAVHAALERHLASFFRAQDAIVFPTGYLANVGALSALAGPADVVVADRLCHASLIDACRASGAVLRVFRHQDAGHLASVLARYPSARRRFIVTEGIFSMEGDAAPLRELVEAAERHQAVVYLDDAHGAFAVGPTGRGSPEHAGVPHDRVIYMGTLGKALGCQGGFVVGPTPLVSVLRTRARTFIYTTALAVPVAAAADAALSVVEQDPSARERLTRNVLDVRARLAAAALPVLPQGSHIVPVRLGSTERACRVAQALVERGLYAPAIRPPTVPQGTARLRISISALHAPGDVARLADVLQACLREDP
ncbi:MAG: 8-amino-7-oxononanoate synthase [Candidatus Omnitrophica bacterium]|nr:8-amino-7-oxononanoate synthase [Candidatus Omnitrophota bacterium]